MAQELIRMWNKIDCYVYIRAYKSQLRTYNISCGGVWSHAQASASLRWGCGRVSCSGMRCMINLWNTVAMTRRPRRGGGSSYGQCFTNSTIFASCNVKWGGKVQFSEKMIHTQWKQNMRQWQFYVAFNIRAILELLLLLLLIDWLPLGKMKYCYIEQWRS